MKTSDLLVRALEAEQVRYVFGVPGEENLDLLESLRSSSIQLIVTRHEQGAGFMAATMGRLTGRPGVALSTLGPGATNLLTPAAYAQLGAMPLVLLTGQKPIKNGKQGHFQIVDVVEMMRPVTKYARQIPDGNSVPALVREAFRIAEQERPGAVHLELPEDVARENTKDDFLFPVDPIRRPAAEAKAVARAVRRIQEAQRPLLLIGAGANRNRTRAMLRRFVDRTQMPFFTTQMGKGVLDERSELYLGTAALSDGDELHRVADTSDLIVNVGHDVVEKPPFFMHPGRGPEVIHVNYSPAEVDPVYFPQYQVIGDIANAVWQMSELIEPQNHWQRAWFRQIAQQTQARSDAADSDAFPVELPRLVRDVRSVVPEDGIVALDNGLYKIWFARNYPAYEPNSLLLDNALASMGAGLPSAMAACLVRPCRKVVAVCGDGGFLMSSQELETATRLKLDLVVLVLRDDGYGMIRWKQQSMGFSDFGLAFGNPDFVAYANAYGVHGVRLKSVEELAPVLESCLRQGGIHLIEVPIDYGQGLPFRRGSSDGG